jgi:hypothetical protein
MATIIKFICTADLLGSAIDTVGKARATSDGFDSDRAITREKCIGKIPKGKTGPLLLTYNMCY